MRLVKSEIYPLPIRHSHGTSTCLIFKSSTNGYFSTAVLKSQRVVVCLFVAEQHSTAEKASGMPISTVGTIDCWGGLHFSKIDVTCLMMVDAGQ